jgi:DNA-binding LacI/PurR family transcriptional regulator
MATKGYTTEHEKELTKARIKRYQDSLRSFGLKPRTMWLTEEEYSRLKGAVERMRDGELRDNNH